MQEERATRRWRRAFECLPPTDATARLLEGVGTKGAARAGRALFWLRRRLLLLAAQSPPVPPQWPPPRRDLNLGARIDQSIRIGRGRADLALVADGRALSATTHTRPACPPARCAPGQGQRTFMHGRGDGSRGGGFRNRIEPPRSPPKKCPHGMDALTCPSISPLASQFLY